MSNIPLFDSRYQDLFDQMDRDKGGLIDKDEFISFFKKLEPFKSKGGEDYLHFLFKMMDKNKNQKLSFNEFLSFARGYLYMKEYGDKKWYFLCFKTLDIDNSNSITIDEMKELMEFWGRPTDDESCLQTLRALDKNFDGEISFSEFCTLWN